MKLYKKFKIRIKVLTLQLTVMIKYITGREIMSKYCSDCKFLNTEKAKCDGVYYCNKLNSYANACNSSCDKFEKTWLNGYEQQKLYDLGKKAKNKSDDTPIGVIIFIFIAITVWYLIVKLCGY